jgi:RHS repeat-associated protein
LADANLYRFSSKEFHVASGLVYYLYRFYEPTLQRWLNRDPIQDLGGLNLYEFVGNDPVYAIDVFGLAYGNPVEPPFFPRPYPPRLPSRPRPPPDKGPVVDTGFGGIVGGGVTTIWCCNDKGQRVKATFVKSCIGLYLGISATVGYQQGVGGKNCPGGYSGWFIEAGGGLGIIAGGGNLNPGGTVGGPGIGIGLLEGVWLCNYALLNSEIVGCCK